MTVVRLSSCVLLFLVTVLPSLVKEQNPDSEVGAVTVELMIVSGSSVTGGGSMTWDLYSFPGFSSPGTGVFKTRFLETDPSLTVRYGGYAQLEWIGSNSAQLRLRDLDLDYESIRFDPFSSTTEGLFYSVTLKNESQRSIYKNIGNRIEHVGGLLLASDNDTVVFRDILKGLVPNISVIKPGGVATLLVKKDDPVPGRSL